MKETFKKYKAVILWSSGIVVALLAGLLLGASMFGQKGSGSGMGRGGFSGNLSSMQNSGKTRQGGGFTAGKVIAKDAQSLTVRLASGNTEIVFYSSSTQVIKPETASMSDIASGTEVMIGGAQSPEGSVIAQSIQIKGNDGSGSAGQSPAGNGMPVGEPGR